MDVANLVVALLALIIAAIALARGSATERKLARIEEDRRREEVEARQHADLMASIVKEPRRGSPVASETFLLVVNSGAALASDVGVEVIGDGLDVLGTFPSEVVAGQDVRAPLIVTADFVGPHVLVNLRWVDASGAHEK